MLLDTCMTNTAATKTISWDIHWNRGTIWTNFDSKEEAQAKVDRSVADGGDDGVVVPASSPAWSAVPAW